MYVFKKMRSPVGEIKLVASEKGLSAIVWEFEDFSRVHLENVVEDEQNAILLEAEKQLSAYFKGERNYFKLPLDFKGTDFQKMVWEALLTIPFGQTRTYGQIARQIGKPNAVRAVGGAANKNPLAIIAPCHRVIGASGKLTGFAGGLDNKTILLNLENNSTALKLQL